MRKLMLLNGLPVMFKGKVEDLRTLLAWFDIIAEQGRGSKGDAS